MRGTYLTDTVRYGPYARMPSPPKVIREPASGRPLLPSQGKAPAGPKAPPTNARTSDPKKPEQRRPLQPAGNVHHPRDAAVNNATNAASAAPAAVMPVAKASVEEQKRKKLPNGYANTHGTIDRANE